MQQKKNCNRIFFIFFYDVHTYMYSKRIRHAMHPSNCNLFSAVNSYSVTSLYIHFLVCLVSFASCHNAETRTPNRCSISQQLKAKASRITSLKNAALFVMRFRWLMGNFFSRSPSVIQSRRDLCFLGDRGRYSRVSLLHRGNCFTIRLQFNKYMFGSRICIGMQLRNAELTIH